MDITYERREIRYGMPAADQIVFNRYYILGYSYYFRQAKWALEIVRPQNPDITRMDVFRPDYRVPEMFRADLADYESSGYSRGHLVASANKEESELQNSETFLLSNMSPQNQGFNAGIWKKLEIAIRDLNAQKSVVETYVVTGPLFDFDKTVKTIGTGDRNGVSIPVPHYYFKSVLTENHRGTLKMYSFIIPNAPTDKPLESFTVPTVKVERYAGIKLWGTLTGTKMEKEKTKSTMW